MTFTLGVIAWFIFHEPTKKFVSVHVEIFYSALIMYIVLLIALMCCEGLRRKYPRNIIILALFTISLSYLLAVMSAIMYTKEQIFLAVGITGVVCLTLTLFAFQTKYDFTMCSGFLCCLFVILFLFGIASIWMHSNIMILVYAALGALIYSFKLVYDTQLIIDGSHRYKMSPEEYVFAALTLYIDIVYFFLHVLRIMGARK